MEEGVDFNNQDINKNWLPYPFPLLSYDDVTLETIFVDDKVNFLEVFTENGKRLLSNAQTLIRDGE